MPHIDDGTLHAFLDGALDALAGDDALPDGMGPADVIAHLEQCADCRARLDIERETRERAGLVLRDAVPRPLPMPPFAAARARTPSRRSVLPYAWAASLVLALGAGWWGSQIVRDPRAELVPGAGTAATSRANELTDSPSSEEAADAASPAQMAEQELTPLPAEPASAGRAANTGDASAVGAVRTERLSSEPSQQRAGAQTFAAADAASTNTLRTDSTGTAIAAAPPPPAVAAARVQPLTTPAIPVEIETSDAEMQRTAQGHAMHAGVADFMARDAAGQVTWREVTALETDPQTTRPVYALRDTEILGRDVALEIGIRAARVRQRLGTGEELSVVTWEIQGLALEELVVTGAPADSAARRRAAVRDSREMESRALTRRSARVDSVGAAGVAAPEAQKAAAEAAFVLVGTPRNLPNARHEMVFTAPRSDVFVVVHSPRWLTSVEVAARIALHTR